MATRKTTAKKKSGTPTKQGNPPLLNENTEGTYLEGLYKDTLEKAQRTEEELRKKIKALEIENKRLQEENTNPKGNSNNDGIEREIGDLKKKNNEQHNELKKLEDEVRELKTSIDTQKKELEILSAVNKRLQDKNAKQKETSPNDGLHAENLKLKEENAKLKETASDNGNIQDTSKLEKEQADFKRRLEDEISDLKKTIDNQKKELEKLRAAENQKLKEENAKLKETASDDGKKSEVKALEKQVEEERKRNIQIASKLEKEQAEFKRVDGELSDLKDTINAQKKELETLHDEIQKLKEENAKLKRTSSDDGKKSEVKVLEKQLEEEKKRNEAELRKLERENAERKQKIEHLERENGELIEDHDKRKELMKKQTKSPLPGNNSALMKENEALRNRLSELAGAKLTEGNPNIADLSDKNRPTNLAENFSELYDNEWTDALEELLDQGKKSEEEGIKVLLDILKDAYEFSSNQSTTFYSYMSKGLNGIGLKDEKVKNWPIGVSKQIKDVRKSISVFVAGSLSKEFITSQNQGYAEATKKYAKACASLCWFMCVQDPPVFIEAKTPKGAFNKDLYRAYTKSGQYYAFLVWPPLYLYKGGQLLGKGIAQGC
ncbi:uncharacterized protein LOC111126873 isoform X1 [Crassostrea virginica]